MKTGGVRVVSVGYLRYWVCCLGLTLAAGAGAVEVQRPAPVRAQPVPAAHCRFLMPTEGGRYALYRSLDSRGLLLQQSAQWVDAFIGNPAATVTLSVEWRSRDYMFELPMGMANFYLRGSQPNDDPLQLRFVRADGSIAKVVEAGPGYSQPTHAAAYLRVGELLSAIGEDADIRLEVRQGEADRAVTTLTVNWSTIPLRAAIAAYPVGRGWLDRAQAKPAVFCTPT